MTTLKTNGGGGGGDIQNKRDIGRERKRGGGEEKGRGGKGGGGGALPHLPGGGIGSWPRSQEERSPPGDVHKYQTPMLIPPVMPRAATLTMPGGKPADYYEISMRQFTQQILPAGLPATTVWGYGAVSVARAGGTADPQRALAHDRGHAQPAGAGEVDQRPGGRRRRLPAAPAAGRPDAALGEPAWWHRGTRHAARRSPRRRAVHRPGAHRHPRHGAVGVGDESDGYAEAWYPARREQHSGGYATEGTWYDFFAGKAAAKYGVDLGTGLRHVPVPEPSAPRPSGTTTTRWA